MIQIQSVYINGRFEQAHGTEIADIISPLDKSVMAQMRYADEVDTHKAIKAASKALLSFRYTSKEERKAYLKAIHDEILKRLDDLIEATILEYGASQERSKWSNLLSASVFLDQISVLDKYSFEKQINESTVVMEPVGVSALFTPWNSTAGSIAVKLSAALAAGCTVILKPSEFAPRQAAIIMESIAAAGLPEGVVNMVNGRGEVISKAFMESAEVTKISFTGSTSVGTILAKQSFDTMKRVTLELGGKSANIILDDADLTKAIPMALQAAFMNNGQACIAGTRLLVPESRLLEIQKQLVIEADKLKVGNPLTDKVDIGPLASERQYSRIQEYIRIGMEEGAKLLYGGLGYPEGLEQGYYVKPTIFVGVNNQMRIAREEIFGPVLSVIPYSNEDEAIAIANDTEYGLMAFVSTGNEGKGIKMAHQLKAGRVLVNTLKHDPLAPFGGYKHSGIGRENGVYGLEGFLEVKTLIK
ncbi:aldehyde dehydrogenase family protein [Marinilongibacter aquaticus]|uniref:aldehyde dehydrogenase family protein n=1 Tax=Marinilongibacter aquaticus TaxID=2975157 RepID=UPI0021BD16DF|nr:aldehyde dehydrogenase family protein [Marinilongibacter aquaticus]UBM58652.1 aldehyde dehydrogenase family protein [Marinilongibacter aquaticus]